MKLYQLIIPAILASCSTKKQLHQTIKESSTVDSTSYQQNDSSFYHLRQQGLWVSQEQTQELTRIMPKGLFTYSPDSGFRGEAEEIRIFRQADKKQRQADSSSLNAGSLTHASLKQIQSSNVKNSQIDEQKSTNGFSWKFWSTGILLLIVLVVVVRLKYI